MEQLFFNHGSMFGLLAGVIDLEESDFPARLRVKLYESRF